MITVLAVESMLGIKDAQNEHQPWAAVIKIIHKTSIFVLTYG